MTRTNERERVTIDDLNLEAYKGYLFVPNRFIQRELDTKSTIKERVKRVCILLNLVYYGVQTSITSGLVQSRK
ncbi:hypothetical protein GQR36_26225 [Enterococcus termitis]